MGEKRPTKKNDHLAATPWARSRNDVSIGRQGVREAERKKKHVPFGGTKLLCLQHPWWVGSRKFSVSMGWQMVAGVIMFAQ
jgi:hypothetical protein